MALSELRHRYHRASHLRGQGVLRSRAGKPRRRIERSPRCAPWWPSLLAQLSGGARRQIARQPRCQYPKNRSMLLCHNSITRTSTSHGHYCSGHQRCRRHSVARCRPVANIAGPTDDEAGAGPVRPADAVGSFAALDPGRRSQAGHEKATSRRRGSPGLVVDHGKSAALKVRQAFSHGVKLLG